MNHHNLSLTEYLVTIILVLLAVVVCYNYLGAELAELVEVSFNRVDLSRK